MFGQAAMVAVTSQQIAFRICHGLAIAKGRSPQEALREAQVASLKIAATATGLVGTLTVDPVGTSLGVAYLAAQGASPPKPQSGKG